MNKVLYLLCAHKVQRNSRPKLRRQTQCKIEKYDIGKTSYCTKPKKLHIQPTAAHSRISDTQLQIPLSYLQGKFALYTLVSTLTSSY